MANAGKVGKDHVPGSLLLGADVSRGFVVRTAKRGAKRGGMGAVRVHESYLRADRLLFSVSGSLLGGSSASTDTEGCCYVCPTAEFLHCYLELFSRPEIAACFEAPGSSNFIGPCRLLLLHSELAKLTGAAGALSIRQERQLIQISQNLRGTLVFFDQFCPDLHSQGGISTPGLKTNTPPAIRTPMPILAACSWCRAHLENASMVVLTDESDGIFRPHVGELLRAVGEDGDLFDGVRVLDFDGFIRDFIGSEAGDELSKRGDVLRRAYSSIQAPMVGVEGAKEGREGTSSRLAMPHPSRAKLEAMIAAGEAFRGKLDVFEHNPREGVVVVGGGEGSGERLKDWADTGGRTQVLVVGKEGMNRSIHGDMVAVTLLPKSRWRAPADRKRLTHVNDDDSGDGVEGVNADLVDGDTEGGRGGDIVSPDAMPTGFVVGILEEGRRPYVVTIPPEERAGAGPGGGAMVTVTAVPMDPRVPKIRIKTRQLAQISGHRLVATVDGWDAGHVFPFGHYVTSLGPVGEVASEAAALLVECQASFEPFSFNALASLPSVPNPPREAQESRDDLLPPSSLAEREKPEDGFGRAPSCLLQLRSSARPTAGRIGVAGDLATWEKDTVSW